MREGGGLVSASAVPARGGDDGATVGECRCQASHIVSPMRGDAGVYRVKQVVLTRCRCAQRPCVYTPCAHVKDPVVHVRVLWIMET